MEFKGTKGKWEVTDLKDGSGLHYIFGGKYNTLIARTCYLPLSAYNAQLISKAPEMLEMLKKIQITMDLERVFLSDIDSEDILKLIKEATCS